MAIAPDPWDIALQQLYPSPDPYVDDPAGWVSKHTREHLWSAQMRIMESVRDNRRTAVPACHGPGKSFTAARLVAWWLSTHPPGSAFAVTTAPTDPQVKAILWREIQKAHRIGNLPGRVTLDAHWKMEGEIVAYGRKPADHDEHAFQGIHARYVLVILDEACGIPKQLWTAASTLLTNDDARFLAIGNPDDPTVEFAAICEGADPADGGMSERGWNVLPIPAMSTPNFTGEHVNDDMRHHLVSHTWCDEFALDMGGQQLVDAHHQLLDLLETGTTLAQALADPPNNMLPEKVREILMTSPLYVSKVLGQFPQDATNGVVLWSWIKACTGDDAVRRCGELMIPRRLGVDVGGSETGDETVVYELAGMHVGRRWAVRSSDPDRVAKVIEDAIREAQPERVKIDSIGIGWGIMGMLRRTFPHVPILGVNVGQAASEPSRFVNLRSEIWWTVGRGLCKDRGWDLTQADQSTLLELAAPRWWEDRSGRVQVESKDEIRKRIDRSTDNADALLLAVYEPPTGEVQERPYEDQRLTGRR